jgi:sugar phosphate isomerase/epimerase
MDKPMNNLLTRRKLLTTGAVAAATYAVAPAYPLLSQTIGAQMKEAPFQLGLTSYTFRNFDRSQLIGYMKTLGLHSINAKDVKDHLPMDPAKEAEAIADYNAAGIKINEAGAIYFPKDEDDDIRSKFEYCKRAGVKVIVAGDPEIKTLPRIEKFVKEYDIRFAIHNHGPEDKIWPSPLTVLDAVKEMDPRMGCCIDVGHTTRAGTDVIKAIHQAGPRLFDVHMKDLTSFDSKESQVAVGEGIMPVRRIFETLIQVNYNGYVDLEYEIFPEDPMPGVIASFSYMRGVLAGIGYKSR